jgi:hypothetical protein
VVTESDEFVTSGSGDGFLTFSLSGEAESDPAFYINGVYEGGCFSYGCIPSGGTLSVTLGVPFDISVEAEAAYTPSGSGCCTSDSLIQATVQVYELVDYSQEDQVISEFATPEPGAGWLGLFGLAAMAVFLWEKGSKVRGRMGRGQ